MTRDNSIDELNSTSLTTRGFRTDTVVFGSAPDNKELARMEGRAILDAVAQQIQHRKSHLAAILGQALANQAALLFLEMLESSEPLMKRAERLHYKQARNAYIRFIVGLWDQFERFLLFNAMEGARNISVIAQRSPYPDLEEQKSWLKRLFNG